MARKVIWTDEAVRNLETIFDYVAKDSPAIAAAVVSRIIERSEQMGAFPLSGRMVPEHAIPHLRELFWRDYRILYRVEDQRVVIMGVVHGSRRLDINLEN